MDGTAFRRLSLQDFFSFELLIVALLFIGLFKKIPSVHSLPIDATLLILIVAALVSVPIMLSRWRNAVSREALVNLLFFAMLIGWMCLSLLWSPGHHYALRKAMLAVGICFPLYVWGTVIVSEPVRFDRFLKLLFLFTFLYTTLVMVWYFTHIPSGGYGVFRHPYQWLFNADPIGIARAVDLGLVLSAYFLFFVKSRNVFTGILLFFVTLFFAYGSLLANQSGPFLAAWATVFVQYAFFWKTRRGFIRYIPLLLVVISALIVAGLLSSHSGSRFPQIPPSLFRIWFEYTQQPFSSTSLGVRMQLFSGAFSMFLHHFWWGGGVGSFSHFVHFTPLMKYPHNAVLEIAAELGIVGLLLLGVVIVRSFYFLFKNSRSIEIRTVVILISLFFYALINAMVSSDFTSDRLLLLSLGFLCLPTLKHFSCSIRRIFSVTRDESINYFR